MLQVVLHGKMLFWVTTVTALQASHVRAMLWQVYP
jgi:hypothetical protein